MVKDGGVCKSGEHLDSSSSLSSGEEDQAELLFERRKNALLQAY